MMASSGPCYYGYDRTPLSEATGRCRFFLSGGHRGVHGDNINLESLEG